ncbi:MAG: MFS transporter, partial [Acidimicrobiia bacterium]
RAGRLSQRIGPRIPMTVGPMVVAAALLLLSGLAPGDSYLMAVLPGITVLGLGLAITVAPLTAAVLAAVDENHVGIASGVNNAVARVAGLLSVAVLPVAVGLSQADTGPAFSDGVQQATLISAGLALLGGLVAAITIRKSVPQRPMTQADLGMPCHAPECAEEEEAPAAA